MRTFVRNSFSFLIEGQRKTHEKSKTNRSEICNECG